MGYGREKVNDTHDKVPKLDTGSWQHRSNLGTGSKIGPAYIKYLLIT